MAEIPHSLGYPQKYYGKLNPLVELEHLVDLRTSEPFQIVRIIDSAFTLNGQTHDLLWLYGENSRYVFRGRAEIEEHFASLVK